MAAAVGAGCVVPHDDLYAQDGRWAAPVLTLPASTRAHALGDAATALRDESAVFANPANLVGIVAFGVDVQRFGTAATALSLRSAMAGPGGTIAIGVQGLDWGAACGACTEAVPRRTDELLSRGPVDAASLVASMAYARTVKGLRVGAAAKYAEQRLGADRSGTVAADIGVSIGSTVGVGLAVRNIGRGLMAGNDRLDLPTEVAIGVATAPYTPKGFALWDLTGAADMAVRVNGTVLVGGGMEATFVPVEGIGFAGRLGARVPHGGAGILTVGAGVLLDSFALDYTFHPYDGVGSVHRLGVRWRGR